jgi:hypothetical protein
MGQWPRCGVGWDGGGEGERRARTGVLLAPEPKRAAEGTRGATSVSALASGQDRGLTGAGLWAAFGGEGTPRAGVLETGAGGVELEPGSGPAMGELYPAHHGPARTGLHRSWAEGLHEVSHPECAPRLVRSRNNPRAGEEARHRGRWPRGRCGPSIVVDPGKPRCACCRCQPTTEVRGIGRSCAGARACSTGPPPGFSSAPRPLSLERRSRSLSPFPRPSPYR